MKSNLNLDYLHKDIVNECFVSILEANDVANVFDGLQVHVNNAPVAIYGYLYKVWNTETKKDNYVLHVGIVQNEYVSEDELFEEAHEAAMINPTIIINYGECPDDMPEIDEDTLTNLYHMMISTLPFKINF